MYQNDIYHIPPQKGIKKVSITISPSFDNDVHFEFYQSDDAWYVYWVQELSLKRLLQIIKDLSIHQENWKDWEQIKSNPVFLAAVRIAAPIFSRSIDGEVTNVLQNICDNGLSVPAEKAIGFDGHCYFVTIDGFPEEYDCWCVLPPEWISLKTVIDKCIDCAGLDYETYGCSI